ncbi:MAG TPA: hypothetical protein VE912_17005 [Bacteroidales bacterium]|nr:hypothetical protein [Bacteroidales bacterium]
MTKQQLKKKLQDPFYFIPNILGAKNITREQNQIIESVWSNKYTEVPSGHAVGKTYISAAIFLAYLVPYPDTIVLSTAPSKTQVTNILWAEIRNFYINAATFLGGRMLTDKYVLRPKWFGMGISVRIGNESDSATNFQGYHQGRILVIVDEACGVHPAIWEAIDGVASNKEARVLSIGNPSMINVPFHKHSKEKKRSVIPISCLSHPNVIEKQEIISGAVSYNWVKEKLDQWCEPVENHDPELSTFDFEGKIYKPNNLFRWKILGKFPTDSEEGLFTFSSIQKAMESDEKTELDYCHIAVDVARFGEDSTCWTINQGGNFKQIMKQGLDVTEVAEKTLRYITAYKPSKVGIDADGIGSGVYDILKQKRTNREILDENKKEIGVQLIPIQSGRKALEKVLGKKVTAKFQNIRCQMYWQLRLDLATLKVPFDEKLQEELLSVDYETPNGVITVTKKDEIKASIGRSPDRMDSLVYCNWMKYEKEKKLIALQSI